MPSLFCLRQMRPLRLKVLSMLECWNSCLLLFFFFFFFFFYNSNMKQGGQLEYEARRINRRINFLMTLSASKEGMTITYDWVLKLLKLL